MAIIGDYYKVLPGNHITGKHRVYYEGEVFPIDEACGDMENALKEKVVKLIPYEEAMGIQNDTSLKKKGGKK